MPLHLAHHNLCQRVMINELGRDPPRLLSRVPNTTTADVSPTRNVWTISQTIHLNRSLWIIGDCILHPIVDQYSGKPTLHRGRTHEQIAPRHKILETDQVSEESTNSKVIVLFIRDRNCKTMPFSALCTVVLVQNEVYFEFIIPRRCLSLAVFTLSNEH